MVDEVPLKLPLNATCDSILGTDYEPSFIAEESFVRAPLNSRVSGLAQPSPKVKGKERAESLDGLPLEVQESLILEDLLFVLMVRALILALKFTPKM